MGIYTICIKVLIVKAPIHFAVSVCADGDTDIISILLQHKADLNLMTKDGKLSAIFSLLY